MDLRVQERTVDLVDANWILREEITEHQSTENALRESEFRYRSFVQNCQGIAFRGMLDFTPLFFHGAVVEITGYTEEEFLAGNPRWDHIIYEDDLHIIKKDSAGLSSESGYNKEREYRIVRKDGKLRWVQEFIQNISMGPASPMFVQGAIYDITGRKRAEQKLHAYQEKLSAMSMELSLVEERERRNIASDLHDHIVQTLAMTRVRLGGLGEHLSGDVLMRLEEIKDTMDMIINDTRKLMFSISPPMLYDLGFIEAVEWLVDQIQEQSGITVELEKNTQGFKMDLDTSVILFKAVRELFSNIVKHALTKKAKITIQTNGDELHISVEDDGIGYDFGSYFASYKKSPRFGILNLLERIKFIGGDVKIKSSPGEGTCVQIVVPLETAGQTDEGKDT